MPIDVQEITDKQRDSILAIKEGHFSDLKAKEIKPAKLTKAISAFANADGGELYIGVGQSDQGHLFEPVNLWNGFEFFLNPLTVIFKFSTFCFRFGEDYLYCFLSHKDETGLILQVVVSKSKGVIKASDGKAYVRRGAQSLPADTPAKIAILERNKGITSFESEPVSASLASVCNSESAIKFILDVVPASEPEDWLRKQELIKDGKPTVAGVVLFSDLPQAILPKRTGVKIYRYKTGDDEGTRETLVDLPVSVEGCAYDVIKAAVAQTKSIISNIQILGTAGLEPVSYPTETLHEVITNAVLHRDYSIADDVHVRIFDNRVEVESPGRLPAHITTRNILKQRFSRNGNLVRVINKFPDPPNKDVGEGLNTAFRAMRKMRLKEPVVLEVDNAVIVHIRHEQLASADTIVMEYLESHPMITNRIAREQTGIPSENSMKLVFLRLRDTGLIRQVHGRSGSASAWERCHEALSGIRTFSRLFWTRYSRFLGKTLRNVRRYTKSVPIAPT